MLLQLGEAQKQKLEELRDAMRTVESKDEGEPIDESDGDGGGGALAATTSPRSPSKRAGDLREWYASEKLAPKATILLHICSIRDSEWRLSFEHIAATILAEPSLSAFFAQPQTLRESRPPAQRRHASNSQSTFYI